MSIRLFAYLTGFLLFVTPLQAQIKFYPVTAPEGTSWGEAISAITQDAQGYIWLGSLVGFCLYMQYNADEFHLFLQSVHTCSLI